MSHNMIVDYKVIRSVQYDFLAESVVNAIRTGWQPLGGLAVDPSNSSSNIYAQAMVKYKEDK